MLKKSGRKTSAFRRAAPGRRFQERYWHFRDRTARQPFWWRLVVLAVGGTLAFLGFVMLFIPGPGILLLAAGGAMTATQSLWVARVLDWVEVKARLVLTRMGAWWGERKNRG